MRHKQRNANPPAHLKPGLGIPLQQVGEDVNGHVLKTMKLRGQISQGLALSLEEVGADADTTVGTDLTEVSGVVKYREPLPASNAEIIGTFDQKFAPKTNAERIQNLVEHWEEISSLQWIPTVKVDGTSQTLVNDEGTIRIFSRNWELDPKASPGFKTAEVAGLVASMQPGDTIQFELCGPGIQGNRLRLSALRCFVFAMYREGSPISRSLWPEKIREFAVPELDAEQWGVSGTMDEMIKKVSGLREAVTKGAVDEGIVYHLAEGQEVPVWLDRNQNFKIINNKYLLKYGL